MAMQPEIGTASGADSKDATSLFEKARSLFKSYGSAPASPKAAAQAEDPFVTLSLLQQADGSFALSDALVTLSGITRENLDRTAAQLSGDRAIAERIVATVAALDAFERRFPERKSEWRAMAEKAQRWLDKQKVAVPAGGPGLRGWVNAELKR